MPEPRDRPPEDFTHDRSATSQDDADPLLCAQPLPKIMLDICIDGEVHAIHIDSECNGRVSGMIQCLMAPTVFFSVDRQTQNYQLATAWARKTGHSALRFEMNDSDGPLEAVGFVDDYYQNTGYVDLKMCRLQQEAFPYGWPRWLIPASTDADNDPKPGGTNDLAIAW